MILFGVTTIVLLACGGLLVEEYVKENNIGTSTEAYEDEIPELGIQPQSVSLIRGCAILSVKKFLCII